MSDVHKMLIVYNKMKQILKFPSYMNILYTILQYSKFNDNSMYQSNILSYSSNNNN